MFWVTDWLKAFALTETVEIPIVLALTRAAPLAAPRRAALAFFASLATHPLVWFVFPALGLSEPVRVALSETWAWGAEAVFFLLVFPSLTSARAISTSAMANGVSFSVGLLVRAWTGWV